MHNLATVQLSSLSDLDVYFLHKELLTEGDSVGNMLLKVIKEQRPKPDPAASEPPPPNSEGRKSPDLENDLFDVYNSVVYGLPHIVLIPPSQ